MAWAELQLIGLRRAELERASAALFAIGAAGLQEDHLPGQAPPPRQPWDEGPEPPPTAAMVLRAWFEEPDQAAVEAALRGLSGELRWAPVADTDWGEAWKRGFTPIVVSERLVVAPPWDAPPGALVIEPGQGFGTGHHPTTVQALRAVDALAESHPTVLDVGTGSGVLALAAARLGATVWGIDVEEAAIRDARRSAVYNGLTARLDTTPLHRVRTSHALVLANLHGELIVRLVDDLARVTGRTLVLAGILADREAMVGEALAAHPLEAIHREQDDGWVSLRYRRLP